MSTCLCQVGHHECVSVATCSLDPNAEVVDVAVQQVEHTHHAGHSLLAELHAILELQAELLLTAVVQCGQEGLGILT